MGVAGLRGPRVETHRGEEACERERDNMMKSKTERHVMGERKGEMGKIKHEERFRKGNEAV